MRFIAHGARGRTRVQFTIEAEDKAQATIAAEAYGRRVRATVPDVHRDYAHVRILDGDIEVLSDIFEGTYQRLQQ